MDRKEHSESGVRERIGRFKIILRKRAESRKLHVKSGMQI